MPFSFVNGNVFDKLGDSIKKVGVKWYQLMCEIFLFNMIRNIICNIFFKIVFSYKFGQFKTVIDFFYLLKSDSWIIIISISISIGKTNISRALLKWNIVWMEIEV